MPIEVECDCYIAEDNHDNYFIEQCDLCKAAPRLLAAAKALFELYTRVSVGDYGNWLSRIIAGPSEFRRMGSLDDPHRIGIVDLYRDIAAAEGKP